MVPTCRFLFGLLLTAMLLALAVAPSVAQQVESGTAAQSTSPPSSLDDGRQQSGGGAAGGAAAAPEHGAPAQSPPSGCPLRDNKKLELIV
jgi:Flp pilus assembly protein TadD